jgi:hypothetical protein
MGHASTRDEQPARTSCEEYGAALVTFTSRLLDGNRATAQDIVPETRPATRTAAHRSVVIGCC